MSPQCHGRDEQEKKQSPHSEENSNPKKKTMKDQGILVVVINLPAMVLLKELLLLQLLLLLVGCPCDSPNSQSPSQKKCENVKGHGYFGSNSLLVAPRMPHDGRKTCFGRRDDQLPNAHFRTLRSENPSTVRLYAITRSNKISAPFFFWMTEHRESNDLGH